VRWQSRCWRWSGACRKLRRRVAGGTGIRGSAGVLRGRGSGIGGRITGPGAILPALRLLRSGLGLWPAVARPAVVLVSANLRSSGLRLPAPLESRQDAGGPGPVFVPGVPIRPSPMSSGRSIRRTVSVSRQATGWVKTHCASRDGILGGVATFLWQTTTVEVTVKKLLGALAVAGMAVVFSPSGADAATCWWNGYTWVCRTPSYAGHWRHNYWHHHHWREARGPWGWHHHHWRHWDRPYAWYR